MMSFNFDSVYFVLNLILKVTKLDFDHIMFNIHDYSDIHDSHMTDNHDYFINCFLLLIRKFDFIRYIFVLIVK